MIRTRPLRPLSPFKMIYHVVAVAENGVIGKNGKLPWHFPADLKFFKNLTTGHTVIMGRKTFDGIGKPLPNRENIVISRQPHPETAGVKFVESVDRALERTRKGKIFIIGGASIFRETAHLIDGIYLTQIHQDYEGDAFYSGVPEGFKEVSREKLQESPPIDVIFYQR